MNEIEIYKGDTEKFQIKLTKNEQDYLPSDLENGDLFTITVADKNSGVSVISKHCEYPCMEIVLTHEDTNKLKPGRYVYDIEYRKRDYSIVKTLMKSSFIVIEDVTRN